MPRLKTHRSITIFFLLILTTVLAIANSFAKMQSTPMIPAIEVSGYYKSALAKGKLTLDENEIMKLATLAQEIFEVKEFTVSGYYTTKAEQVKSVNLQNIANSIQLVILQKAYWNDLIPHSKMNKLKKEDTLLKKTLGEKSLGWAWYLNQNGRKAESLTILESEFERAYLDTMKLKEITGFRGEAPSYQAESINKILTPLSSETDNKSREEKVRKMRLHISNLPNLQMMT